jgi:hypothetical protein
MARNRTRLGWIRELQQFTNRNAGRRTVLEIDDADVGAQEEERGYPLRGVAYDPQDDRVEIMLGDQATVERRLTHSVEDVTDIDILRGKDGRDLALRVVHGGTQTLLKLIG